MTVKFLKYGGDSEGISRFAPLNEINCREHFSVLGYKKMNHTISNTWFSGTTELITYEAEELLGTKIRALFQRSKGRDLFDLYYALLYLKPDCGKILHCYREYMKRSDGRAKTAKEIMLNLDEKMNATEFIGDIKALLRPEIEYDIHKAYALVKEELIEKIGRR
jgi:predicted nucleotidyltransferase component of viral defense system